MGKLFFLASFDFGHCKLLALFRLFSFLVTLGMIPFIRAQRGGIAEFVGDKLDKKIRDNLRDSRNSLFQQEMGQLTFNRPVILLLDRNFDLMTPLSHSWTYQGLILHSLPDTACL